METAKISIKIGEELEETGMVNVWWWKDGSEPNQEWKTKRPIWEFLDSKKNIYADNRRNNCNKEIKTKT